MSLALVPLNPLERAYLHVLRVRALLSSAVLLGLAIWGDVMTARLLDWPYGVVAGPVAFVAIWAVAYAPVRRWRRLGYSFSGNELHVARGWLTRVYTVVPVARVQHIDVAQGVLDRRFGIATLVLHTAGTDAATVSLPGIARSRAEEIRDLIRERLSAELR